MPRNRIRQVAGVAAACTLTMAAVDPAPTGAPSPADASGAVTDSAGMAAVVGLITRIPAEIQGGAVYASSSVNLDKARARAAAFYPGNLADLYLRSSFDDYPTVYDETEAVAENPPNSAPTSARTRGHDTPLGTFGTIRADAPDPRRAAAVATGASSTTEGSPWLRFADSTARSSSRVDDDGTVVTEAVATLVGVRLAEVVSIGSIESRAVVTTAVDGPPEVAFATDLQQVRVAGVAAEIGQDGLVLADASIVPEAEVRRFNETITALADAGITIEAVPTDRSVEPGRGRVGGAALRFRYEAKKDPTVAEVLDRNPLYQVLPLPKELGYDEEFLLGQVRASAVSRMPSDLGFALDLGGLDVTSGGLPGTTGTITGTGDAASTSGMSTLSGPPSSTDGGGAAPAPRIAAPSGADGTAPTTAFTLTGASAPATDHLSGLYRLLALLAVAGAATPRLLRRATTA